MFSEETRTSQKWTHTVLSEEREPADVSNVTVRCTKIRRLEQEIAIAVNEPSACRGSGHIQPKTSVKDFCCPRQGGVHVS